MQQLPSDMLVHTKQILTMLQFSSYTKKYPPVKRERRRRQDIVSQGALVGVK